MSLPTASRLVRSSVHSPNSNKCTQRYKMTRKLIQNNEEKKLFALFVLRFCSVRYFLYHFSPFLFRFVSLSWCLVVFLRSGSLFFSTMVFHRDNFSRHSVCSFRLVWLGFHCVTQNFSAKMVGMLFLWFIFNFRWQKMGFMGSDWIEETENRTKLAVYLYNTGKK